MKEGVVNMTALEEGAASSQCMVAKDPKTAGARVAVRDAIVAGRLHVPDPAGIMP